MSVVSFYYYSTLQSFRSTDPHRSDLSDFPVLVIFQGSQKGRFPLPPYSALRVKALNILIHFERDYPDLSIMSFLTKFLSTSQFHLIHITYDSMKFREVRTTVKLKMLPTVILSAIFILNFAVVDSSSIFIAGKSTKHNYNKLFTANVQYFSQCHSLKKENTNNNFHLCTSAWTIFWKLNLAFKLLITILQICCSV